MLQDSQALREFMLQWSRPQMRTETPHAAAADSGWDTLQWSRPQMRTETWPLYIYGNPGSGLQWSRPQMRTETRVHLLPQREYGLGFNGAVLR